MSTCIAEMIETDSIECIMSFRMTVGEWKQIETTLATNPAYVELKILRQIRDLVAKLDKTFYANDFDKEQP